MLALKMHVAKALQPGTIHPCQQMSEDHETKIRGHAGHEDSVKFFGLIVAQAGHALFSHGDYLVVSGLAQRALQPSMNFGGPSP